MKEKNKTKTKKSKLGMKAIVIVLAALMVLAPFTSLLYMIFVK